MLEAPEVETHHHKTGHSLVDYILGGTAVFLSMVSVFIAVRHGQTMERLVEANSWPNLSYASGNISDDGTRKEIRFMLRNTGVGPARVETVEFFYKGKPYASPGDFLKDCCGQGPYDDFENVISNTVLPAREADEFFSLRPDNDQAVWDKLNRERFKVRVRACYCSVFDECWIMDSAQRRPERIAQCAPSQPIEYQW